MPVGGQDAQALIATRRRSPRGKTAGSKLLFGYQGPPERKHNGYKGWDRTGGHLLAYAMPRKKTYLTGKGPSHAPPMSMAAAKSIIDDGRGWTRRDRNSFYDALTTDQLIARLGNWSPVVRQRAAEALGRRKDDVIARLIGLLDAKDAYTRQHPHEGA